MTCDHEQLVAYLYEELEPDSRVALEAHLRECPACRGSLEELQGTRRILGSWSDEDSKTNLVFVRERDAMPGPWARLANREWRRPLVAAATAVAAVLTLALLDLDLSYEAGRLSLHLDLAPGSANGDFAAPVEEPVTRQELLAAQARTLEWVQVMMGDAEAQRLQVLDQRLSQFARALEQQRYTDLHLVDAKLREIDRYTENRFQRNEAAIQWLVPASHRSAGSESLR